MKVARGALLNLPLPLGEGRGEGNGHGERRLSSCGVALVAMAVSRDKPAVLRDISAVPILRPPRGYRIISRYCTKRSSGR
jgi:hypothetical protein